MNKSVVAAGFAFATSLLMTSAATATVTLSSVPFDSTGLSYPGAGQQVVTDFNSPAIAAGYSFAYSGSDTGYYTGLTPNIAAAPAGDMTQFFSVATNGNATLSSTHRLSNLSLLIGSIDQYNLITFNGAGGFSQSFDGSKLYMPANGDQGSGTTNRQFSFNFDAADRINEVVFTSSGNSFEFDNISAAAVPEPATWAMLILGSLGVGFMLRSSRRKVAAAVA